VEVQNHLGIYLSKAAATVVCLTGQGREHEILGCFSVSVEEKEERSFGSDISELAGLISQGCAERGLKFSEVAVALDCAMFMQHNVHSEFHEPKQIAQTIKFDTEEALATDISDVAVAFKITSSDQSGSGLTVFTSQRKMLSEIILSLQNNNIDPVAIEPDINCLLRFISHKLFVGESRRSGTCFGILSGHNGYFVVFSESSQPSVVRTLLIGPTRDRNELLAREVSMTAALVERGERVNCLRVFDSAGSVNSQQLGENLGIEVKNESLTDSIVSGPEVLADCSDRVDFVIAYGAALTHLERAASVNFRSDFMPYQGGKIRLRKALKVLSLSLTVIAVALGLYFHLQLLQINKYRGELRGKFENEYSAVMAGKKPPSKTSPLTELSGELRRIRNVKEGQLSVTGEESISSKLTLVLDAFNKCAAKTDLNIESVSITSKTISIIGDTSSRKNTLELRKAIESNNLAISQENLELKDGRDNFRITIVPKR